MISENRKYLMEACDTSRKKYIRALSNLATCATTSKQLSDIKLCRDQVERLDKDLDDVRIAMAAANTIAE